MFTHDEKSIINVRRFCMTAECGQKMTENVMIMDTQNFNIPIRLQVRNECKIPPQEHSFLQ